MSEVSQHRRGASVELRGISRLFGSVAAVNDLDLRVEPGEFLSILGPSGCGKSTLLRIIGGLDRQTSGTVLIDDSDVSGLAPEKRPTSTVFQQGAVFPHLTVFDNVAYPLRVRRSPRNMVEERVHEYLRLVRMDHLAHREPTALSGGQLQRVSLARALAAEPAALLMDEPLSALDAELKRELQVEIRRIHRKLGKTIIFVTHDQEEAMSLSDRIAVMNEGVINQCDTPEHLYRKPVNEFVARFLGHSNILTADLVEKRGDAVVLDWRGHRFAVRDDLEAESSGQAPVSVRPPCVQIDPPGLENSAPAVVKDVIFIGDAVRYELAAGDAEVWAQAEGRSRFATGDEVSVTFRPDTAALLSRRG